MKTPSRILVLSAVLLGGAIALSGCAVVDEIVYKQRSADYADTSALSDGGHSVAWVPGDGTRIRIIESTQGPDKALRVTSPTALDTAACRAGARLSGPSYAMEGTPNIYKITDAFVCGEWTVVATADGWFGWTPNSVEEQAAAAD